MKFFAGRLFLLVFLTVSTPIFSATLVLKPDADTALFEAAPTNNLGGMIFLPIGVNPAGQRTRPLVHFDLSTLPVNAVITNVNLAVHVVFRTASATEAHKMLVAWTEGTGLGGPGPVGNIGALALQGEPTWLYRSYPTISWGSAGGLAGTDFATAASASSSSTDAVMVLNSADLTSDVIAWAADPGVNFGWMLLTPAASAWRIGSRDDPANAPILTIDYTFPPPAAVRLLPATHAGAAFRFSFDALANTSYSVETRDAFNATNAWVELTNLQNVSGRISVTNTISGGQRFYRVRSL